jgi:hypothetical protein
MGRPADLLRRLLLAALTYPMKMFAGVSTTQPVAWLMLLGTGPSRLDPTDPFLSRDRLFVVAATARARQQTLQSAKISLVPSW